MEKEIDEHVFADGFNKGYWLFTYEPEIAKSFIEYEVTIYDDFSDGFSQGLNQAAQERTLNQFEQLRDNDQERDHELER